MKLNLLGSFLLFASLTWGQSGVPVLNGQPQPLRLAGNSQRASAAPMGEQQSLLSSGTYSSGKGERPIWEVAPSCSTPLGDTARALRKQHETAKKAIFIREN